MPMWTIVAADVDSTRDSRAWFLLSFPKVLDQCSVDSTRRRQCRLSSLPSMRTRLAVVGVDSARR